MAVGVVETFYKLKYYIFVDKKHTEKAKNTGNFVMMWAWLPCKLPISYKGLWYNYKYSTLHYMCQYICSEGL